MMIRFSVLHRVALAAALFVSINSASHAGLVVTLHEDGAPGPVADQVFTDVGSVGAISVIGSIGDFRFTLDTAISNALLLETPATLDVSNSIRTGSFSGTRTLVVTVSDSFTSPADFAGSTLGLVSIGGNTSSAGSSLVSFQSFLNSYTTGLQGPLIHGTSDTATIVHIPGTVTAPYTITNVTTIVMQGNTAASTSGSTSVVVPEPASLAVWGLGMSCIGLVSVARRRRGA